jgi:phosphopantothenoylcysteine decarboxylase / phosphopantothenate---cysteine ligase
MEHLSSPSFIAMCDGHFARGAVLAEASVLLIVGGGIAAYKALEVTRLLRKAGIAVRPILTSAGQRFVTPLSLSALAEEDVRVDLFSLSDEARMGHIELTRSVDLVLVAPATADLMAKAAHGLADDLASTALLATDKPVMMAPAMNVRMWLHAATQRNLTTLKADGVLMVGPDEGAMACGEFGPGRMVEPPAIFEAVMAALSRRGEKTLSGMHVLVTAGPTAEAIDPVRVLTNRSSGKQGYAIAGALAALGARVTLVSGPTALASPPGVDRVDVESARDMLTQCQRALPADAAVCVAAVSDWRPDAVFGVKLKKGRDGPPSLRLVENPDILATLAAAGPVRPRLVVGFAAETNDLEANARAKLTRKGCDWIVGNDVSEAAIMGGDENEVLVVDDRGVERWTRASKGEIARRLADRIAGALA